MKGPLAPKSGPGGSKSWPRGPEAKTKKEGKKKEKKKKKQKEERTVAKVVPSAPLVLIKRNVIFIWIW